MSRHSILEYIKYRVKALGRHGTHSPFVYDFVEAVNPKRDKREHTGNIISPLQNSAHNLLLSRIATHYNYKNILDLAHADFYESHIRQFDMILFRENRPQEWLSFLHKLSFAIKETGAIVIPGIHRSAESTQTWNHLRAHGAVKMSIDLYGIGLLLFRDEFKVKQHFVVKC